MRPHPQVLGVCSWACGRDTVKSTARGTPDLRPCRPPGGRLSWDRNASRRRGRLHAPSRPCARRGKGTGRPPGPGLLVGSLSRPGLPPRGASPPTVTFGSHVRHPTPQPHGLPPPAVPLDCVPGRPIALGPNTVRAWPSRHAVDDDITPRPQMRSSWTHAPLGPIETGPGCGRPTGGPPASAEPDAAGTLGGHLLGGRACPPCEHLPGGMALGPGRTSSPGKKAAPPCAGHVPAMPGDSLLAAPGPAHGPVSAFPQLRCLLLPPPPPARGSQLVIVITLAGR